MLSYSTYLGGSDRDLGAEIAVDEAGNAYVTGYTLSDDFPTTPGAFQLTRAGEFDAFVTKLVLGLGPTGPLCDIRMSGKNYSDGQIVTALPSPVGGQSRRGAAAHRAEALV